MLNLDLEILLEGEAGEDWIKENSDRNRNYFLKIPFIKKYLGSISARLMIENQNQTWSQSLCNYLIYVTFD